MQQCYFYEIYILACTYKHNKAIWYVNDTLQFYTDKYALILYKRYDQLMKSMAAHL